MKGRSEGQPGRAKDSAARPDAQARYGAHLLPHHAELLAASAIAPDVATARGYRSIERKADLERKGFSPAQRNVPGLLIPVYSVQGELATYQYRPDEPRVGRRGAHPQVRDPQREPPGAGRAPARARQAG